VGFLRLTLPLILVFVFGIVGLLIQYIPLPQVEYFKEGIAATWLRIMGGVAGLLGIYVLIDLHVTKMKKREEGWGYSLFFFAGFFLMAAFTLYNAGQGFWRSAVEGAAFDQFYTYLFASTGATMFSLLGFFIASAAVRTFRARSFETSLLLAAAFIVMLGRAPLGEMMSPYFPRLTEWLMAVPNAAAKRGILLGVCLGSIAMSFRIIFGVERSYLGGKS
jgi:hypothetical protein